MQQQCYEFYECKEPACVKHRIPDEPCWELEGTPCKCHNTSSNAIQDNKENKERVCKACGYYEKYCKTYSIAVGLK